MRGRIQDALAFIQARKSFWTVDTMASLAVNENEEDLGPSVQDEGSRYLLLGRTRRTTLLAKTLVKRLCGKAKISAFHPKRRESQYLLPLERIRKILYL